MSKSMSRNLYVENSQYQVIFSAIFVQTARIFSLLFLIPAISFSSVEMSYDDDKELEFYWSPATGNVSYYNVYLFVYNSPGAAGPSSENDYILVDDTSDTHGSSTPTLDNLYTLRDTLYESRGATEPIAIEYGKVYQIKVAAVDDNGTVGPRSESSNPVMCILVDVDKDGKVNTTDIKLVADRLGTSITYPLSEPGTPNPDINGDGVVNVLDLVLVARYIIESYLNK